MMSTINVEKIREILSKNPEFAKLNERLISRPKLQAPENLFTWSNPEKSMSMAELLFLEGMLDNWSEDVMRTNTGMLSFFDYVEKYGCETGVPSVIMQKLNKKQDLEEIFKIWKQPLACFIASSEFIQYLKYRSDEEKMKFKKNFMRKNILSIMDINGRTVACILADTYKRFLESTMQVVTEKKSEEVANYVLENNGSIIDYFERLFILIKERHPINEKPMEALMTDEILNIANSDSTTLRDFLEKEDLLV